MSALEIASELRRLLSEQEAEFASAYRTADQVTRRELSARYDARLTALAIAIDVATGRRSCSGGVIR